MLITLLSGGLAADQLLSNSIMGAVFLIVTIPLAIYCKYLIKKLNDTQDAHAKTLKEIQDKRVSDSTEIRDKLLTVSLQWNDTLSEQVRSVEAVETTLRDVKDVLEKLRDDQRERRR